MPGILRVAADKGRAVPAPQWRAFDSGEPKRHSSIDFTEDTSMIEFNPERRTLLALMAASTVLPSARAAQSRPVLPVNTPGLDHLDVVVPDVEKSTRFYMGLFRTTLHAQPFQGAQRYFVLLGPLPQDRAVGYIAIGASRGRGTYIGHFCTGVTGWQRENPPEFDALKERLPRQGYGEFPGSRGFGGLFNDPDGLEIQFLPSPDKLVVEAVASDLVPSMQGLVAPRRLDHIVARVSDLDRAVGFYRTLYGREQRRDKHSATFVFRNGSRLVLERSEYIYGRARVGYLRFGIRTEAFDRAKVEAGIAALGGKVIGGEGRSLRLRDVDGIELELVPE
jgi:catechol 2,3-dioxygenase-like lactoylglutathione lyase family enzyme